MKRLMITALLLYSFSTIKAQNLSANDKIELGELAYRWNLYTDAPNLEKLDDYMNLWTDVSPVLVNPFGRFEGKDAISKWQHMYNVAGGPAFGKRHAAFNVVSEGGAGQAKLSFDLYLFEVNDVPKIFATGRTVVLAVKVSKGWKIKSYTIALDPGFGKSMQKQKEDQAK